MGEGGEHLVSIKYMHPTIDLGAKYSENKSVSCWGVQDILSHCLAVTAAVRQCNPRED